MSVISTLVVKLTADTGDFSSAMNDAGKDVSRFGKGYKVAQAGAAAGLAAITAIATKSVGAYKDYGGAVNKLTSLMNVSTEDASRLVGQWQRYGIEASTGMMAVKLLSRNIVAAKQGNKGAIASFKQLGISMNDLKNMSAAQVMMKARDAMSMMGDKTQRTALMLKLFGRSGTEMVNWTKQAPSSIANVNKSLQKLGLVWGDKQLKTYKDMAAAQGDMKLAWLGLQMTIAQALIPTLTSLVKWFGAILTILQPYGGVLKYVAAGLAAFLAVGKVVSIFSQFAKVLKIITAAQWLWNAALDANPIGIIVIAIAAAIAAFVLMYKKVGWFRKGVDAALRVVVKVVKWAFSFVSKAVQAVVGFVSKHWKVMLAILVGPIAVAATLIIEHWSTIEEGVKAAVAFILKVVTTVWNALISVTRKVWDAIKDAVTTVARDIYTVVSTYFRMYLAVVQTVMNAISSIVRSVWNAIKGEVATILVAIAGVVRAQWNAMLNVVRSVMDTLRGVVSGAARAVVNALRAAWSGIAGIAGGLWSGIKSRVLAALDFYKSMLAAGRRIATGLWDGLSSMSGWLWGKVKGIASGVFNAVKSGLGKLWPNSPSKAGVDVGYWLGKGIEKGIHGSESAVRGAVSRLGALITVAPEAPALSSMTVGAANPNKLALAPAVSVATPAPARMLSLDFSGAIFVDSSQAGVERLWNLAVRGAQSVEERRNRMSAS
jgi:phage-related protein